MFFPAFDSLQGIAEYIATHPNRPTASTNKIYFQPLIDGAGEAIPDLGFLKRLAEAWFGMQVYKQREKRPLLCVICWRVRVRVRIRVRSGGLGEGGGVLSVIEELFTGTVSRLFHYPPPPVCLTSLEGCCATEKNAHHTLEGRLRGQLPTQFSGQTVSRGHDSEDATENSAQGCIRKDRGDDVRHLQRRSQLCVWPRFLDGQDWTVLVLPV